MNRTFEKTIMSVVIVTVLLLIVLHDHYLFGNLHQKLRPQFYESPYFEVEGVQTEAVCKGNEIANQSTLVMCGLCRDIEQSVSKNIHLLEVVGSRFRDYRIVLFENDSKDRTLERLREHSIHNERIVVLSQSFGDQAMNSYGPISQKRIDRMAHFRNQYLDYVKQNLSDFDLVMMLDMDVEGYFNIDGLMEVVANQDQWDGVFCNGITSVPGTFGLVEAMYDGFAYLGAEESFENCISSKGASLPTMLRRLWNMQFLSEKWIPVKSAFNGAGIYKMKMIQQSKFPSNYTCEWIGFHHWCATQHFDRLFIARDWKLYVGIQGDPIRIKFFL